MEPELELAPFALLAFAALEVEVAALVFAVEPVLGIAVAPVVALAVEFVAADGPVLAGALESLVAPLD